MIRFSDFALNGDEGTHAPKMELLDEAGNISSSVAIKLQSDVIRHGKDAIRARRLEDKLDYLAKQNGALSGLMVMSIAVSGGSSFMSSLSKGLSFRKV